MTVLDTGPGNWYLWPVDGDRKPVPMEGSCPDRHPEMSTDFLPFPDGNGYAHNRFS